MIMKRYLSMAALAVLAFVSCSNPIEEYIHNELPANIWRIQVKSKIDEEASRTMSVLNSAAADSISLTNKRIASIQAEGREYWFSGGDPGPYLARINSLQAGLKKFKSNQKSITDKLSEEFKTCASEYYEPSVLQNVEKVSDEELCRSLLPSPKKFVAPADTMPRSLVNRIVDNIISSNEVPKVASVEYNKKIKEWRIRFDGTETVVLKAYKREDGTYDYEYDFERNKFPSSYGYEESSTISQDDDWDEILDAYESYVNNYISCVKKAANGDISALTDMAEMLESAESFGDKLDNASSDLSSSQMSRYIKITSKLASAAADMSY